MTKTITAEINVKAWQIEHLRLRRLLLEHEAIVPSEYKYIGSAEMFLSAIAYRKLWEARRKSLGLPPTIEPPNSPAGEIIS